MLCEKKKRSPINEKEKCYSLMPLFLLKQFILTSLSDETIHFWFEKHILICFLFLLTHYTMKKLPYSCVIEISFETES